ncbi:MAG: hypothetical protein IPJ30_23810 [Acidobacteria bacterium]|nr:hypothetical protein [Acidobacteriota bacterium]
MKYPDISSVCVRSLLSMPGPLMTRQRSRVVVGDDIRAVVDEPRVSPPM